MDDAALGVLIKNMHSRGLKGDLDLVAGTRGRARGNAGDDVLAVGGILLTVKAEVQVDLGTHQLRDLNGRIDDAVGHRADVDGIIVQALGTDTDDDLLADVKEI